METKMKTILAFGASSSKQSINKKLASFTAQKIDNMEYILLDLNDFEMPIFSVDKEKEDGIPELAHQFLAHIKSAKGIIISFAEHNGAYSAAFKNVFDWVSRIEGDLWSGVPMFALATSPGGRGGSSVLQIAKDRFKFMGGNIVSSFSLPSFYENFNEAEGILNEELKKEFETQLISFQKALGI